MSTLEVIKLDNHTMVLQELENAKSICSALMKTPHYSKMGEAGIFAIVQKAKSIGMDPLEALNGGMYFVQGKVEMQGQSMLAVIRSKGHSVSIDARSTATHVIMHGQRADNGDRWTVDFSVDDAKRAGIYRGQWEKQPKVMCMWRCVSQLGRFLFSDVLKGVYVQGEISECIAADQTPMTIIEEVKECKADLQVDKITKEQAEQLLDILSECPKEDQEKVSGFMTKNNIKTVYDLPLNTYTKLKMRALEKRAENIVRTNEVIDEAVTAVSSR